MIDGTADMERDDDRHQIRTPEGWLIRREVAEYVLSVTLKGVLLSPVHWREIHTECRGLDSCERQFLIPYMSDELLAHQIEHTLRNCSRAHRPPVTYEDAIQAYAQEAAKRLARIAHGRAQGQTNKGR